MAYIYALRYFPTQDCYIGCSKDPKKRFREHRSLLRRGKHECPDLQALWDHNPESDFGIKIVEDLGLSATTNEKRERETYWMETMDKQGNLLNQHQCSFAPPKGAQAKAAAARVANNYRPSPESNRKRSLAQKGVPKRRLAKLVK